MIAFNREERTVTLNVFLFAALLMMMDANVVQVDWSGMGSPSYVAARLGISRVGKRVGRLLQLLVAVGGANYADMHIIGHSLGAHVAGIAARSVGMGSSRQGRVTGENDLSFRFQIGMVVASLRFDSACCNPSGALAGTQRNLT